MDLRSFPRAIGLLVAVLFSSLALAQRPASVLMLSDIHFDPFHDPGKFEQLRQAPAADWGRILASAPSPTQAVDLAALQDACHARALDTAWPLLKTSLLAAHGAEPHPAFVTLTGDLLAHEFPCRFRHLAAGAAPQDLSTFAARTVAFVLLQLQAAFPHVPVYAALGNNDSGCADYRETAASSFVQATSSALAAAAGISPAGFTPEGDYTVLLPAPLQHTRLLVLQDNFEGRAYNTCAAAADRTPQQAQIDWLRSQLAAARSHHESVWVMSHMPPGIDVYTSFRRYVFQPAQLCSASPQPFLADPSFADALLDFADTVRLLLLGHTHMDEFRVLHRASGETIPAKIVPSVTPVIGNHPAFLLASVDPHTAVLTDWRTFVSPGPDGSTPPWTEAYRFSSTYHVPDFSAGSALRLADGFTADKTAQAPASTAFREHFYPGDLGLYALGLAQIWPAYSCVVRNDRPSSVHSCICDTQPPDPAPGSSPTPP